jgi:hypothetical protein
MKSKNIFESRGKNSSLLRDSQMAFTNRKLWMGLWEYDLALRGWPSVMMAALCHLRWTNRNQEFESRPIGNNNSATFLSAACKFLRIMSSKNDFSNMVCHWPRENGDYNSKFRNYIKNSKSCTDSIYICQSIWNLSWPSPFNMNRFL